MKSAHSALVALILGSAGACSTAPCTGNPNTDSISCVQAGISSGQYQRRVEERQAEARDKQRQVDQARAENERLQMQIADAKSQEAALRAKLASQRAEIEKMAVQVNRATTGGQLSPGESALVRAQVDLLKQRQTALEQAKLQNREMQARAAALQREIDELKASLERRKI
jgi:chromosome segregation ATPase